VSSVLFVCKCVLNYFHRVATQLRLNISYHVISYQQPHSLPLPVGQGFLIVESSPSHSDTPHSVGLLWTNDRLVAETCTWRNTTLTTDSHLCLRRYSSSLSQEASGHWDRHTVIYIVVLFG